MKKIITLFQRNYETDRLVNPSLVPGAEWVLAGEGQATVKIDGTSCLVRDGKLYKRYELRKGKTPPPDFIPAQEPDPVTGEAPGWLPVGDGPDDKWHREAWENSLQLNGALPDWTYELVGPKVQGNPYQYDRHVLKIHGKNRLIDEVVKVGDVEQTFTLLRDFFAAHPMEGIVWWRDVTDPDCDKVKLKSRDYGIKWPLK